MDIFLDKVILITGGTGSLGNKLVEKLLNTNIKSIVIYSRDEFKQSEMKKKFLNNDKIQYIIGDIRDRSMLDRAISSVDFVIHTAALKHVDISEQNPLEFVKTNVLGSQNVIDACIDYKIKKVVALSTDKASSPINAYGATKLIADKLFIAANKYSDTKFSVVRYGNVMMSRGSAISFFKNLNDQNKKIPLTDNRMTRFWIDLDTAADSIIYALKDMTGGELYIPKMKSVNMIDVARSIAKEENIYQSGLRPGEKLHEELISIESAHKTFERENFYVVAPDIFKNVVAGNPVDTKFVYKSDSNSEWISQEDVLNFIKESENL